MEPPPAPARKLIMWNHMSLDGYFEGPPNGELDWMMWGEEGREHSLAQLRSADALLFGRRTYEGMAEFWSLAKGEVADLMNELPKVVFSRTLRSADWNNSRVVAGDAATEVARLRNIPGKDLYLFGSANLAATLTRARLIDEYRVGVTPVLLGAGNPLFRASPERLSLALLGSRALKNGTLILRYAPVPPGGG
jgi:dihydrofolate reductase